MKATKRRRLEKAGWEIGDAAGFLGLNADEQAIVEMKLALADQIKVRRLKLGMTQTEFARRLGSSQSRIAKMEVGDGSASLDSLVRALLALGVTSSAVGKVIGGQRSPGARLSHHRPAVKPS
jgi:DNA-binding XRE family transcriptional regulator